MIPARYSHPVVSFLLSGMMSFVVTGVATLRGHSHLTGAGLGQA